MVVGGQGLLNALRQRLLDFGKLILLAVSVVVLGVFLHALFVLQRVVVVVDPHHAIERIGQRPVKGRAQSFRFLFESGNRRTDLEKPASTALNGHSQLAIAEYRVFAIPFGDVTHAKVILNVALKQVPTLLADALHDRALSEDHGALLALSPCLRTSQPLSHQRRAEIVEQLGMELMAIGCWHRIERGK